jgi:hypothetical protein
LRAPATIPPFALNLTVFEPTLLLITVFELDLPLLTVFASTSKLVKQKLVTIRISTKNVDIAFFNLLSSI